MRIPVLDKVGNAIEYVLVGQYDPKNFARRWQNRMFDFYTIEDAVYLGGLAPLPTENISWETIWEARMDDPQLPQIWKLEESGYALMEEEEVRQLLNKQLLDRQLLDQQ